MWINPSQASFKPICGDARVAYTCIWVMQPSRLSRQNCAQVVDNALSRRKMPRAQNLVENCGKPAHFSTDPCTIASTKTRHPRRFIHRKAAFIHRFWGNCAQIGGDAGAREGVRRSGGRLPLPPCRAGGRVRPGVRRCLYCPVRAACSPLASL